jgi:uncharacterized C2H2 Zn-finger protein
MSNRTKRGKKPQCPKCHSSPSMYRELASTARRFDLEGDQFNEAPYLLCNPTWRQTGFDSSGVKIEVSLEDIEPTGEVLAECSKCEHIWKLRNFKYIDELIEVHGFNSAIKPDKLKLKIR